MKEESIFLTKHKSELMRIRERYRKWLLDDIVPFWQDRLADHEYGGYFNCFDRKGNLTDSCKMGWFVGRNMYTYAALYNEIEHRQEWLDMAKIGRRYMDDSAFYAGNGHFNQMMERDGNVRNGFISLFTDHFAAKGLYEYIVAAGLESDENEMTFAKMITDQLFSDVKDPEILKLEGITDGSLKHAINFMTQVVALESRKVFGSKYDDILRECTQRTLQTFASDQYQCLIENVYKNGTPTMKGLGRIFDAGHSMESIWFSMHAAEALHENAYLKRAGQILEWIWDKTYDKYYGGFYTQVDIENHIPLLESRYEQYTPEYRVMWDDKIWWTHAEAISAFITAALYMEDETAFERFCEVDQYVSNKFVDSVYGEWYSILSRDGEVKSDCKGFESKGPYHVPRCMMIVIRTIERYLNKEINVCEN